MGPAGLETESLVLTRLLAAAHLALYGWALWATRYPVMTVFHGFLAVEALAFGVRPLLAAAEGGYTLYPATAAGWAGYNLGLAYQWLFNAAVVAAYLAARRSRAGPRSGRGAEGALEGEDQPASRGRAAVIRTAETEPGVAAGFLLSLLLGVAAVGAIHVLSQGAWLPGRRAAAITAVVPYGKLLFPLAVIPLGACLPLAYLVAAGGLPRRPCRSRVLAVAAGTALACVLLELLYQRGYLLNGLLVAVFLHDRLRGVDYARAAVAVLAVLVLLGGLRPLAGSLAAVVTGTRPGGTGGGERVEEGARAEPGAERGAARHGPSPVRAVLLYGANFDHADVWPVALDYAAQHGWLRGATLAAVPARFLAPPARQQAGLRTAVDRLNEYYWRDFYWRTRFGFNVSLPQELYLNLGAWPLPVAGALPGLLTALCDRWLWGR
ncbi:MAG TPA: polyprenyl glycosylphosphotransferase, partial [Thermaerobacter sp.]